MKFNPLYNRLSELSLSVLLALQIITIFVVGPLTEIFGNHYHWGMDASIVLIALVSLFFIAQPIARGYAIAFFGICFVGLAISPFITRVMPSEVMVSVSALLFNGAVTWIVGRKIFSASPVTLQHIRGAIIIYLNIALSFAMLDNLLQSRFPGAFSHIPENGEDIVGSLVYFSLTTLTTTGYGDILPIHPLARSLATLEAVVGQFYLGTLIATLVGLHVSHRQTTPHDKGLEHKTSLKIAEAPSVPRTAVYNNSGR
jgi:hypothetical protein